MFREYELRDPLRRLEEALGEGDLAVPAGPTEVRLSGRVRAGAVGDIPALAASAAGPEPPELCLSVRPPETPEGALFAEGAGWRFAVTLGSGGRWHDRGRQGRTGDEWRGRGGRRAPRGALR